MRALSSRPFCPCGGRRVSLRYLSAVGRYTAQRLLTQIARIVAINGLQTVTPQVVDTARDTLVIGMT